MGLFGILSTFDSPLLPGYLACLQAEGISEYAVICDSKNLSSNQHKLLLDRIGGYSVEEHFDYSLNKNAYTTPFYFVSNHNSPDCISLIKYLRCSFLLNAGTPRKLDVAVLDATDHGVINVHPGLLPNYRGKNCPEWAIYYGDSVILTAHIMTNEYDEGDVLGMLEVDWRSLRSYVEFRKQVYLKSFKLSACTAGAMSRNSYKVLFNSKSSIQEHPVHDAMSDEILENVKRRFANSNIL